MKLTDCIRAADPDICFSDLKIHLAVTNPAREDPLLLFRSGEFAEWQTFQTRRNFSRRFVLSMIKMPSPNEWLFAGIFERRGMDIVGGDAPYKYDLVERREFCHLTGRAVLAFQRKGRQSYLDGEHWVEGIRVVELTRERLNLPAFPGYRSIHIPRPLLREIIERSPEDWRIALSQVSGIYIIRDDATQQLYVGSATGAEGIWQRWGQYASGDGGNVAFRELFREGGARRLDAFHISLVETADFNATPAEVRDREEHWKRVLGTRVIGLNRN